MTTTHKLGRPVEARLLEPETFQLRDVDTTAGYKMLGGLAVPYDRLADIGWFLEEFAPGSLAKSIREAARGLPLLLFHNGQAFPVGVAAEWKETAGGLEGRWKLDDSPEAQRAAKLAKPDDDGRAPLGYMSIRFAPIRSEWTYADEFDPDRGPDYKDRVRRTEARLLETSLVSTPAYKEAAVSFVRTGERAIHREASGREVKGWREYLERVRTSPRHQ